MAILNNKEVSDGVIFVRCVTTRSGKKIYAWQYGKKAFPIRIKK